MPGALDQVAIVAVTDVKGTIVYANEQFARISKYATHELIGQNHRILNSGEHSAAFFKAMYRTIAKGRVWRGELRNRAKDGSHYWVDTWVIPAVSQSGKIVRYISIRVDITSRKEAEAQQAELASELKRQNDAIAHMTQHDALTGLPNRLLLLERLRYALTGLSEAAGIAVLLIDLDRFRDINDTLGHQAGDRLLKLAGRRLAECIGSRDTPGRFGGDEFAIVQLTAEPAKDAASLASRLLTAMQQPFEIDGRRLALGASVGIALPADGDADPPALLRSADLALHRAKCESQGTYRFFEVEMDQRMQTRLQLEVELRQAFADRALELHYQPLVSLSTNQVNGFEALLRWAHPSLGMVPPEPISSPSQRRHSSSRSANGCCTRHAPSWRAGRNRSGSPSTCRPHSSSSAISSRPWRECLRQQRFQARGSSSRSPNRFSCGTTKSRSRRSPNSGPWACA